jgi:hypothetical protein
VSAHDPHRDDDDPLLTAADFCLDAVGHGCFATNLQGEIEAFVPSVRDRLIERGALYQTTDSRWHLRWETLDLERERALDMACCDFCSRRPVTWLVPCVSFPLPPIPGSTATPTSEGDWAACEPCGAAVAAGDRAALLARSLAGQAAVPASRPLRRVLTEIRREIQRRFWRHYRGGALRVTPHPYGH